MPDQPDPKQVKLLLSEALSRPAPERQAFVEAETMDDAALREEVLALLGSIQRNPLLLSEPTRGGASVTEQEQTPSEAAGTRIGRYKLLQEIGEGGFGTVWMAEQQEPVVRRVALKIIKLGMDTKQVIARFEAERQALALMDHPNVAKVLDGGATDSGRPYFVMELVRGVPITHYCDEAKLTTMQRLELFMQVCHALQHAHQKGIIHRDIKPSNVLVTLHDGQPVPKVIDFGIAKATDKRLTEKTLFTEFQQMIGTPEYMSPEQAEMSGLDIDTRADIYSLGVLLYELLTGTKPFDVQELRERGYAEMLRIIREEEPLKPSTRISTLGKQLAAVADKRRETGAQLGRYVRGDLDWIVMKALEKDRRRRYETARDFAEDVRRHLEHEPVQAGPPSAAYRLRKYVRRHRVWVTTGAVVFVALVGGSAAAMWGLLEARDERDAAKAATKLAKDEATRAERERERAQEEEKKAKAEAIRANTVFRLVEDMLTSSDPHLVKGKDYTVRQLLDDFDRDLGDKLKEQPAVEASMRGLMGRCYLGLGLPAKAERHIRDSMRIREDLFGNRTSEFADALVDRASLLHDQHDYAGALRLLEHARGIVAATPDAARIDTIDRKRSDMLLHLGRYAEAARLARQVINALEKAQETRTNEYSMGLGLLGKALARQGLYAEAEATLRQAVAVVKSIYGPEHTEVAASLMEQGRVLSMQGKYAAAETVFREVLRLLRLFCDPNHPNIATTLGALGDTLAKAGPGRHKEAEERFEEALKILRAQPNPNKLEIGIILSFQGGLKARQARYADAEELLQRSLELLRAVHGEDHANIRAVMTTLARTLFEQHKYAESKSVSLEALRMARLAHDRTVVANCLLVLANCLKGLKEYDEADKLYRQALAKFREYLGEEHESVAACLAAWTGSLIAQRKYKEAEELMRQWLASLRGVHGDKHPMVANALMLRGFALFTLKQYAEAETCYQEALKIHKDARQDPRLVAVTQSWLGRLLDAQGRYEEAERCLREALDMMRDAGMRGQAVGIALRTLADSLSAQGRYEEAEKAARSALETCMRSLPRGDPNVLGCFRVLSDVLRAQDKHGEAITVDQQALDIVRASSPPKDPSIASWLARLGSALLEQKRYKKAEPLLRECLDIRQEKLPNSWLRYNAMSLLGGALSGQGKHADAEPLLVEGYEKMRPPAEGAKYKMTALERVVELYAGWGKEDEATRWRARLDAARKAAARGKKEQGKR